MKLGLELPPTVLVLAPRKHGYVSLASYPFPICIGYGYGLDSGTNVARAYQSKKKKIFFIPGTAQIRS